MNDILFGNNNKAVIKKLANRSFRSNKMRNVIAVIAIALTTFLFTAVLTIGMGAKGTLEYNMAKMIGTGADALVQGLSEEQFQQLKENSMFEKVGCWVPIEIMTNTNRMVAEIDYADQPQLELRMQTPRTGSAPQKANEVLVSANILKDLNIEEKIGAEIPIEFKNRQSGQMYHFDMIVSGIYDTPNEKSESVIVSKAFMEENPEMMREIAQGREGCGIYDADVIMRDSSMVKERISEFVRSIGGNPDDRSAENYVRVAPNTFLSNNSGGSIMWLVAGVFGVLFMFCGYLLIYNVFEIAVTNDIRQYGLLRTVGTTSQQIKRLVNRQALYLFLIGTPFGLLFGILLGRSILPAALQMFAADYSGKNIEVSTLPYLGIIVGAILFSGLTVYISTRKSVKKASRVSPIEAIRYVEQDTVSIKRKKTNTGAVIPRMAKANLQRNKRRTVFIVISLTLSIVLLNSVFIFSGSFDEATYVQKQTRSDFAVYNPDIQAAWGDEFGHILIPWISFPPVPLFELFLTHIPLKLPDCLYRFFIDVQICLYRCLIFLADPVGFDIPVSALPVQSVQFGLTPFLVQAIISNKLPLFFIQIHFVSWAIPVYAKMLWEKESHLQYPILRDASQVNIILTNLLNISVGDFFFSWQV